MLLGNATDRSQTFHTELLVIISSVQMYVSALNLTAYTYGVNLANETLLTSYFSKLDGSAYLYAYSHFSEKPTS